MKGKPTAGLSPLPVLMYWAAGGGGAATSGSSSTVAGRGPFFFSSSSSSLTVLWVVTRSFSFCLALAAR